MPPFPSALFAIGYGIRFGGWSFRKRGQLDTLKDRTLRCLSLYLKIIMPLLALAALIEGSLIRWSQPLTVCLARA